MSLEEIRHTCFLRSSIMCNNGACVKSINCKLSPKEGWRKKKEQRIL